MTTIAYNHEERRIAFDSRVTAGDGTITNDEFNKCHFDGLNHWFIAGTLHDQQLLIDIHRGFKAIDYELDAYGLRVDKNGNVDLCANEESGNPTIQPINYNYAIGTGYAFAFAAMDFGRTVRQAVEYARTRDSSTGGLVNVFDIALREVIGNAS